jgi:tRNA1(Val) A37 N6-methylase TrmN6
VTAELTCDPLLRGRLRLWQPKRGVRVTMDPLLLVHFLRAHKRVARGERVLDLGCGTGVMALALIVDAPGSTAVGVEIVPAMAALARKNAEENGVSDRLQVIEGDLRDKKLPWPHTEFDLIVVNPPYQPVGRGRLPATVDRAVARAETSGTLRDSIDVARRKLSARGRLALVLPAGRLAECFAALAEAKLSPLVVRAVHSVASEPARRVLVAAGRGHAGEMSLLPPLVIHGGDRRGFTAETAAILGDARPPE